jgi:hypothetical protein
MDLDGWAARERIKAAGLKVSLGEIVDHRCDVASTCPGLRAHPPQHAHGADRQARPRRDPIQPPAQGGYANCNSTAIASGDAEAAAASRRDPACAPS